MKERPILFSGEMVRAILDGRKTQTRRVVVPQPIAFWDAPESHPETGLNAVVAYETGPRDRWIACPFGQPGDRLWVRETFIVGYPSGAPGVWSCLVPTSKRHQEERRAFYRADGDDPPDEPQRPWRSSIHMPRWASRLTLEVTGVRVERLQAVNGDDARAEGVGNDWQPDSNQIATYRRLWDSLNAKRGYGWNVNPWVWVLEFSRQSTTESATSRQRRVAASSPTATGSGA